MILFGVVFVAVEFDLNPLLWVWYVMVALSITIILSHLGYKFIMFRH